MLNNINAIINIWYQKNKRDLPWRNTRNPYFIWLSEIILQQTRVNQGMAYYEKFIKTFPTILDLAKASEQEVLNNWQGLGYYSRARNLHKTAKIIEEKHKGAFPNTYKKIILLPGIGDYTASAISSFCFDEAQAVLDGNVFRVLSRIFNISTPIDSTSGKKEFRLLAQEFLDLSHPAVHNQAIMEFGALQCTPKSPNCETCPLLLHCEGRKEGKHLELPVKAKKTKVRTRKMVFLLAHRKDEFVVNKREKKDIWQHLYQFPLLDEVELESNKYQKAFEELLQTPLNHFSHHSNVKHLLSHQKLLIEFYTAEINEGLSPDFQLISDSDVENFPFPRPIEEFLKNLT